MKDSFWRILGVWFFVVVLSLCSLVSAQSVVSPSLLSPQEEAIVDRVVERFGPVHDDMTGDMQTQFGQRLWELAQARDNDRLRIVVSEIWRRLVRREWYSALFFDRVAREGEDILIHTHLVGIELRNYRDMYEENMMGVEGETSLSLIGLSQDGRYLAYITEEISGGIGRVLMALTIVDRNGEILIRRELDKPLSTLSIEDTAQVIDMNADHIRSLLDDYMIEIFRVEADLVVASPLYLSLPAFDVDLAFVPSGVSGFEANTIFVVKPQ